MSQPRQPDSSAGPGQVFNLTEFFPYQTRLFYRHVVENVSRVYGTAYGLKPYEWRAISILGERQSLTPAEIVELSSMDKVSVSRAVAGLRGRGWLVERTNQKDGRSKLLKLSKAGRDAYHDLIPKMLEVEQKLLSSLSPDETRELVRLMKKLRGNDQIKV